ncbi:MAG: cardiolipin synthase, partial [Rikenellaceae bacterium]
MIFFYITIAYFVVIAVPIVVSIIYDKRDPVKSVSWIIVVTLIPFIGSMLYMTFGQNFRKQKIFDKKFATDFQHTNYIVSRQLYEINSPLLSGDTGSRLYRDITTLLLNNNRSPLFKNNDVEILSDGRSAFDSIIKAIEEAKYFIHLEYYIIRDDKIGNTIADLLKKKARDGVQVRLIYDDVGSWGLSRKFISQLKEAGVSIFSFMPVFFPLFTSKINYRNHRKIIVIDGKIGFTGGINIADKYIEGLKHIGAWRDIHLKLTGKSVSTLQRVFMADWNFVSGEKLDISSKYFPNYAESAKGVSLQIASSGPDSDWASIMQAFFAAITKANDYIYISSPYFMPNESILTALKVAALSGIDVKLIVPGKSDSKIVYWATRSYITELLRSGVKVYMYAGGFIHSKLMIIDGKFSSVGSANMDVRSFEDNFEVTAFIYDCQKSKELEEIFKTDIENSRRVWIRWWLNRSLLHRYY